MWGVVERESNKVGHDNTESLTRAIKKAFKNMDRENLVRACQRFRPRIEAVIMAGGGYIE